VVLATGFQVQQFLVPMEVYGREGRNLEQQWKENRGAQAYMGTFVHNFPNFAMLYEPPCPSLHPQKQYERYMKMNRG
jgi:cation diffusion facilitator CzcD-associated flavoprotein CzcO